MQAIRRAGLIVTLALASLAVGSPATAPAPQGRKAVLQARIDLCKHQIELAEMNLRRGLAAAEATGIWSQRLIVSLQAAGLPKEKLIEEVRAHIGRMKEFEEMCKSMFNAGVLSPLDVGTSTYARLEAETLLAELTE